MQDKTIGIYFCALITATRDCKILQSSQKFERNFIDKKVAVNLITVIEYITTYQKRQLRFRGN
jgi:hypothetical protein